MNVFISTVPFGKENVLPISLLESCDVKYYINPLNRKLSEFELIEYIKDIDILIAGTELITSKVIDSAKKLKLICRVGIGLDGVDLGAARRNGVLVSYTPDAPTFAVAELTMGFIYSLLRGIQISNFHLHRNEWDRIFGRHISEVTFGIVGYGRIGKAVTNSLLALGANKILINDIKEIPEIKNNPVLSQLDLDVVLKNSDVLTLHLPLSPSTFNLIQHNQLMTMKKDSILINTARGGIVNEGDLCRALDAGHFFGVGIDVYEREPYINGQLSSYDRCLLTAHMGSMTGASRSRMEIEATEEALRFINGSHLKLLVPESEYEEDRG